MASLSSATTIIKRWHGFDPATEKHKTDLPAWSCIYRADLAGVYYDLGSITKEQSDDLRSNGFLSQKPKPTNMA